ncbi:MAG TPA: Hsp70 family protein [Polyangiales bacterium]|nr:Hsp70 family protein [Polyangiales bacterium]
MSARFIVGIDLGTTNTVVAFADLRAPGGGVQVFRVPQLIAAGEVAPRACLPSFRYHPARDELADADLSPGFALPLPDLPRGVVGTFAQLLGSRVPGRLIASAKSWLCHSGVDREAAILPWGAPDDVPKVSPVDASASYLAHLRAAWDLEHAAHPLAEQELVLTVPASFDEAARALTLEAAKRAGLGRVRLLEEPQAAFYAWLDRQGGAIEEALGAVKLALVLDVGGGTTDLTLIRVELRESGPRLTRIAVGDHILLGGDNMDHALARFCEPALLDPSSAHLVAAQYAQLLEQCRNAKHALLPEHDAQGAPPESAAITLLGGGSKLIGAQRGTTLTRAQVLETVVHGFFPEVGLDARPAGRRGALTEFGLPYAADPAITRHVAAFLGRQAAQLQVEFGDQALAPSGVHLPDAVLFNGGVFQSAEIEARMHAVLSGWRGAELTRLSNPEPELAVARGAVAYGLARRGVGLKIGGGSPRSYYLALEAESGVCVLPRGAEEGEEYTLEQRSFMLRIGKPVRFRILTSTSERQHRPGELVSLDAGYQALPDIAAVIEGKQSSEPELQVKLHAQLTEVGTLEMSLQGVADPSRRYQLEFQLRGGAADVSSAPARLTQLHPKFGAAVQLIALFYGKSQKDLEGRKLRNLRSDLEKLLGERDGWELPLLRELFGELLASAKRRRRSADHERVWLNLTGFCLRPGFGYPADAWRVQQVAALYNEGVQFAQDAMVWSQYWILWRRIAGGLDEAMQLRILEDIAWYLEPAGPRPRPRPKGQRAQGLEDMVRLAGALERAPAARKLEIGQWLWTRLKNKELSQASVYWTLGRLGARAPWYGSAHSVIAPDQVRAWLEPLLALDLAKTEQAAFAVAQLARYTSDRARDLDAELRERAALALERVPGGEGWVKLVREGGELGASEAGRVFGEALPVGLRLVD